MCITDYKTVYTPCSFSLCMDARFPPNPMQSFRASCQFFLSSSANPKILKHWNGREKNHRNYIKITVCTKEMKIIQN